MATTAEAVLVTDALVGARQEEVLHRVRTLARQTLKRPLLTVNTLAEYCLRKMEPPSEEELAHDFQPCPLRGDHGCLVYEARPFACRSMWSTRLCRTGGEAHMDSGLVSINAALEQVIEHLDGGGLYGNLLDMVAALSDQQFRDRYERGPGLESPPGMLPTRPSPGFVVPPSLMKEVGGALAPLWTREVDGLFFREALDQVRSPDTHG